MADEPNPELVMRLERLHEIGKAAYVALHSLMDQHYDCNCVSCRSTALFHTLMLSLDGSDLDDGEVTIREWVSKLLTIRREMKRQAAFADACHEAGLSTDVANERPA